MRSHTGRLTRALALLAGSTTVVVLTAVPGSAAPGLVSNVTASLAPHGLQLTWTNPALGTPIVRDVTAESGPNYDPAGTALVAVPTDVCPAATCLYDPGFTNTVARTYAIWATDDGTAATASPNATVETFGPLPALPTALSVAVSATRVVYNHPITLTGQVTRGGTPLPGATVKVMSTVLGGTPALLRTLTSAVDGTVKLAYTPNRSRTYRLVFDGDAFSAGSTSPSRTVALSPRVGVRFWPTVVQWKQSSTFKGSVYPVLPGKVVSVQRWTGTSWTTVTRRVLSSTSTFAVSLALPIGRHTYRAIIPAATDYTSGSSSAAVLTVTARTLVQGDYGPDVLVMERRLAALHYDVGRVDSTFDYSTRHGVTAFQKVEGLGRTGTWTTIETARAMHPHGFRLRYHDSRLTAEVDITRQVLVLARSGTILTIVDISTGSEKPYYQDGVRYIAHTPRGVFSIYHKIDGVRISKLGELYRPSYFYKGWAIHGSGSVPTYPASHGCVRITNPVADRLFSRLAIGTRVAVYDE
jgi:N-acetylmuramoyl-L-alanine amidase